MSDQAQHYRELYESKRDQVIRFAQRSTELEAENARLQSEAEERNKWIRGQAEIVSTLKSAIEDKDAALQLLRESNSQFQSALRTAREALQRISDACDDSRFNGVGFIAHEALAALSAQGGSE